MFALCQRCKKFHLAIGPVSRGVVLHVSLQGANTNAPIVRKDAPRKRLSAREAMERTSKAYKETLAYLA